MHVDEQKHYSQNHCKNTIHRTWIIAASEYCTNAYLDKLFLHISL